MLTTRNGILSDAEPLGARVHRVIAERTARMLPPLSALCAASFAAAALLLWIADTRTPAAPLVPLGLAAIFGLSSAALYHRQRRDPRSVGHAQTVASILTIVTTAGAAASAAVCGDAVNASELPMAMVLAGVLICAWPAWTVVLLASLLWVVIAWMLVPETTGWPPLLLNVAIGWVVGGWLGRGRIASVRNEVTAERLLERSVRRIGGAEATQASSFDSAVTRTRMRVQTMAVRESLLSHAERIARIGSWVWEPGTEDAYWSEELFRILGYDPLAVMPTVAAYFERVHDEDRERLRAHINAAAHGRFFAPIEHRLKQPDGSTRIVRIEAELLPDARGRVIRFVGTVADVTEARRIEHELQRLAITDTLTGLPNRAWLLEALERTHQRHVRRGPRPYSVVFIDLDGFKPVNDLMGHAAGDLVLIGVARRLAAAVRPGDVVARLGGDEFAVVLEDTPTAGAVIAANRLLDALRAEPFVVNGRPFSVAASIGVAGAEHVGERSVDSLNAADAAMYEAKRTGRGRVVLYAEGMHAEPAAPAAAPS